MMIDINNEKELQYVGDSFCDIGGRTREKFLEVVRTVSHDDYFEFLKQLALAIESPLIGKQKIRLDFTVNGKNYNLMVKTQDFNEIRAHIGLPDIVRPKQSQEEKIQLAIVFLEKNGYLVTRNDGVDDE